MRATSHYDYLCFLKNTDVSHEGADCIFSPNNLSGATKKTYEYLYDEIVSGHLPAGSALSELDISKKLHTSRSPVREATMALEGLGMVRRYPGRGCFVTEITAQDINEIFSLRVLLEVAALRASYHLIDAHSLDLLEQDLLALTPEDCPDAYYETDRRLHELIISNCGNVRLMLILRTLNGQIEQLRRISAQQPLRLRASREEHLDLVGALKSQELERACELLDAHIRNVQTSTLNVCMQIEMADMRGHGD